MVAGEIWRPPARAIGAPEPLLETDVLSLSEDASGAAWKRLEEPLPVWVWLQFRSFEQRVPAEAVSMTPEAVEVRWAWEGRSQRAVVWRAAVKHRATGRSPERP